MSFLIFTKANDLDTWLFFSCFILLGAFVNIFFNTFIATLSLKPCKNIREKKKKQAEIPNYSCSWTAGDKSVKCTLIILQLVTKFIKNVKTSC